MKQGAKQFIDMTGRAVAHWTVISRAGWQQGYPAWLCRCNCGGERVIMGKRLRKDTPMCRACYQHAPPKRDLSGQTHGTWTVFGRIATAKQVTWDCRCVCGAERTLSTSSILAQKVSCEACRRRGTGKRSAPVVLAAPEPTRVEPAPRSNVIPFSDSPGFVAQCRACQSWARFLRDRCGRCGLIGTAQRLPQAGGHRG